MSQEQHTDSHHGEANQGETMSITIEESLEEAIETFARLATLGHFAKAATLFEDVLKNYIDELPIFAEYANFLIQQGMYGVLLDRVKERLNMKTATKPETEETVYLELLQALSVLHYEGKLLETLETLQYRSESFAAMIKPPTELTYIQIRSVETYLAIITAIVSVVPKGYIKYQNNVTVELPQDRAYVFETGAPATAKFPWVELQRWCVQLADEHPHEAVNAFRTLLPVLAEDEEVSHWAEEFMGRIKISGNGPDSILARIGAMNVVMRLQSPRYRGMFRAGYTGLDDSEINPKAGFDLLDSFYEAGYDAKSQQAIELELSAFQAQREFCRLRMGPEGLADIAREEANYRLESRCLQLMVAVDVGKSKSPISAILPVLSSGALYTHFAQDAIELVNFLGHVPSTNTFTRDDIDFLDRFPSPLATLQTSVSIGSLPAVRITLDRGDVPGPKDRPRWGAQRSKPTHQAARKGYEAIAQLLCDHDERFLSDVDEKGYLPLHVAAENGHENLLPLLLGPQKEYIEMQVTKHWSTSRLGNRWGTALHLAAANGHEKVVASLLRCKALVDAQDDDGWTALHKASARWQYGTANLLLRHRADVSLKTRHGLTAVELAAKSGFTALVDLILQHQSAGDCDGNCGPALILAVKNRDRETALPLLKHMKAMHEATRSPQLHTALNIAVESKDLPVVELLLEYGADGTALLHKLLDEGDTYILELLLKHGASINIKDDSGKTVLHCVIEKGHRKLAETLATRGPDLKAKDNTGKTVLHRAMEAGHRKLVHMLLDSGADIEAKDDAGKTVFHYAIDAGDREIVKRLQERGADVGDDREYQRRLYSRVERQAAEEGPAHGEASTGQSWDTTRF